MEAVAANGWQPGGVRGRCVNSRVQNPELRILLAHLRPLTDCHPFSEAILNKMMTCVRVRRRNSAKHALHLGGPESGKLLCRGASIEGTRGRGLVQAEHARRCRQWLARLAAAS